MNRFLLGAVCMAFAVAGLFFLRFWRDSRDRLFIFFSMAFFVLAINRIGFILTSQYDIKGDSLYGVRLLAYILILIAIVDKNRSQKSSGA